MTRLTLPLTLLLVFAGVAINAAQEVPAPAQSEPIILSGATIHTVSGKTLDQGEILFTDGKIVAIAEQVERPDNAKIIEVAGKHIFPGLFESHSRMGLTEIAAVKATRDFQESGSINPNVKALVSVYPDNMIIPVTRANGVLFALTAPTGGLISGKSAIIQLDGWTYEDMSVQSEAAMQIDWPSQYISPRRRARMDKKEIAKLEKEQQKNLVKLREIFDEAKRYRQARQVKNSNQKYDARLEAMTAVVEGRLPMMIRADRATDIQSAVAFAAEQKLKAIILGGYDAVACAELLKTNDVPVIVSATHRLPLRRDDAYDASYTLPERLRAAGIKFCISSTDKSETWNTRTLPYHAAMAVGFGLPKDEALKAITLYPAQILGVDDRIGSLEVGKDASLIVTDGDPLETTTQTELAFIQGKQIDLSNRHLRLYKKYEQKYKQLNGE